MRATCCALHVSCTCCGRCAVVNAVNGQRDWGAVPLVIAKRNMVNGRRGHSGGHQRPRGLLSQFSPPPPSTPTHVLLIGGSALVCAHRATHLNVTKAAGVSRSKAAVRPSSIRPCGVTFITNTMTVVPGCAITYCSKPPLRALKGRPSERTRARPPKPQTPQAPTLTYPHILYPHQPATHHTPFPPASPDPTRPASQTSPPPCSAVSVSVALPLRSYPPLLLLPSPLPSPVPHLEVPQARDPEVHCVHLHMQISGPEIKEVVSKCKRI